MGLPIFQGAFSPEKVAATITEHGGAILSGVVPADILEVAIDEFNSFYPSWEEYIARIATDGGAAGDPKADSTELQVSGPFGKRALDSVPLLPSVQSVIVELLGPTALLLQSHLWVKYGQFGKDFDLPLHSDFMNHTFVYPSDDPHFQVIHGIAYYSDVSLDDGPTYIVPRSVSGNEWLVPWFRERSEAPYLYDHEVPITVPRGSILLYGSKTIHRASVMRDDHGRRLTHFFAFGPPDVPWLGWGRWLCSQPGRVRQEFIEGCSSSDLARIGFPDPSSAYWTKETIKGTSLMYPALELNEYLRRPHSE